MTSLNTSDYATQEIRVHIESAYVPKQSVPESGRYFFRYDVRITNEGTQPAKLLSRHWIITDGEGHVEEVKGPGVIGEQPYLTPGESFTYNSFCPLSTSSGAMRGTFRMVRDDGEQFDVEIGEFRLIADYILN